MTERTNSPKTYIISADYRVLDYENRQTNDLYLRSAGIEWCNPHHSYGPCSRTGYHLHIILSGHGYLETDENRYEIKRGQLFLLQPNIRYYYYCDASDPWHYAWINFDGNNMQRYMESAGFPPGTHVRDAVFAPETFFDVIDQILKRHELNQANELLRTGLLFQLVSLLMESQSKQQYPKRPPHEYSQDIYVQHALQFIEFNYNHIKVSDIAQFIGINRSYLTSIFKEKMHISPQEYLLKFKLEKAVSMLCNTDMPIQDIATEIGYENALTFSKIFKMSYGISPKHYRNQYLEKNNAAAESIVLE